MDDFLKQKAGRTCSPLHAAVGMKRANRCANDAHPFDFAQGRAVTRLPRSEDGAAYNLTVDLDVHAIGANSERSRVQIVYGTDSCRF